jgi:protein gp37
MRDLRDLCIAEGVPFFLKQWGTWDNNPTPRDQELDPDAKGGATLDGRLWRSVGLDFLKRFGQREINIVEA